MITGSLVALVTPMHVNGEIDWEKLDQLVEFHIQAGTNALVAVGTTGESATLDTDEHCAVIQRTLDLAKGRIPIIAGTGANSTREAIDLTRAAADMGVAACLLVVPYYNKPTQEGLFQHFSKIAASVSCDQILYNVPGRTACDMSNDTVIRLADMSNIVGIKDATGDLNRGKDLIARAGDRLAVYSGDDATAAELMLMGAKGNISVTANVVPAAMARLCQLSMAGQREQAMALNESLMPLHQKLFVEANPIPVKWALCRMGLIEAGIRLPLTPLNEIYHQQLEQAMQRAGVI